MLLWFSSKDSFEDDVRHLFSCSTVQKSSQTMIFIMHEVGASRDCF